MAEDLLGLFASNDELEDPCASPSLTLPVLRTGVKSLQHVKRLGRVPELTHPVAVVSQHLPTHLQ